MSSKWKQLHGRLLISGELYTSISAASNLIEQCASTAKSLSYAAQILNSLPFSGVTTNHWNALIRGAALSSDPSGAIPCLRRMIRARRRLDALSCSFSLKACARSLARPEASQLHALASRLGFGADVLLATTLLDAYAKVGDLDSARQVFDEMPERDAAAWNVMIAGLAQGSLAAEALGLFWRMSGGLSGVRPDCVTALAALSACSQLGAVREGERVCGYLRERRLDGNPTVCNAIIDMYAKCGFVEKAFGVFCEMRVEERSLVTWNTMIMGFAMHGEARRSLHLFGKMREVGIRPDGVSFLGVLCACNHAGLVDEGVGLFNSMEGFGLAREVKHIGSVVDLLGRAGRVREAYEMIVGSESVARDPVLWQTLLGACKTHGDVEMAELASKKLAEMGSNTCGDFVLLSNVYAARGRWDDVKRVREAMKKKDVRKIPGFSYTEVDGVVHKFVNGDKSHENWRDIYAKLDEIRIKLGAYGYSARTSVVLHDIGEEDKENALCHHSEKLAVAFCLIRTCESAPIQVIKNLRTCEDCHVVFKAVSRMFDREIIVRDRARFHRFKDGECSCRDFW